MKDTKRSLLKSVLALFLTISLLVGSTFAWFTDSVTSKNNIIQSGSLDIQMYWTNDLDSGNWYNVEDDAYKTIFSHNNWEPGYTDVKYIKLVNNGDLAMNYKLSLTAQGGVGKLAEVINVYFAEGGVAVEQRSDLQNLRAIGLLNNVMDGGSAITGTLLADDQQSPLHPSGEVIMTVAMNMLTTAGNEYQNETTGKFTITALATQAPFEKDSFGSDYDATAEFPVILVEDGVSEDVTPVDGKVPAGGVTLDGGTISAFVPEGVKMVEGANKLTLTVTPLENTTSDIIAVNNEILIPVDVHIEGVAADNTVPIVINLGEILPKYLNMGNYHLFHVEGGSNSVMTLVADNAALTAHNQFTYDPLTGAVSVAMASFSEVALLADTVATWEGGVDYSWYDANKTSFEIANADQLYAFAKIVGNMTEEGFDQDSFSGKTVTLLSDINLNHATVIDRGIKKIFYPIGYWNSEGADHYDDKTGTAISSGFYTFNGTFDGNGHVISNIYQNTWEMKGDHNWYTPEEQNFRDGMGLFGRVYDGTVKNLTVDNFASDGEITTTGVIAAYADFGATFENIAITDCNPRVYNIGNGGIVGCVGWYAKGETDNKVTFTNVTVDNTNKISALWGSYDVACGGIVGQYYPTSGQSSYNYPKNPGIHFKNCHVAAQMDVYNDVCANYQYYAYRYAGMLIGSVRENETIDGHVYPKMDDITAEDCTVHFGDWNDYYYCELVANSLASYTHDHQFSRLTQVDNVDPTKMVYTPIGGSEQEISTSGRYNFVVVNGEHATDNATCFHFVDGKVHSHDDYNGDGIVDYETVNGESILVENNRHIYLEFNNLVTGYGWGVTTKVVGQMDGVTILDKGNSVEKFKTKFTGDFLYRVGNKNPVSIGSIFEAIDGQKITSSGVWVSVRKLNDDMKVSGTYSANTSDWTKSTIKFEGTGVVKVTIQDYNYCTPTVIYLEVVDATNLTDATGTTDGGTFVLLCDVNTSDYVNYWNTTLYGNGFTYSLTNAPTAYNSKHGHGILITKNTTLDNLVIVGDVYNSYGAYSNQDYYNSAVDVVGDTTIQNCYISGCAAPVLTRANATITNTTLYGGTVANLMIKSGVVTLNNVTTANYDDGRDLVGMGIVFHADASNASKLILNGTLTQYNFISEANTPSDSNAKILYNAMFDSSCDQYHFGSSPNRYVNTGILSMTTNVNDSNIVDKANTGYVGNPVTVNGVNGYIYTQPKTSGSVNNNYNNATDSHMAKTQGAIEPTYNFDYTTKNYLAKQDGSNDYCYEENGTVYISMDEGDSFSWDTSILEVSKFGETLPYTVSMNNDDYTGKSITFTQDGNYEVVYTYTDDQNFTINATGNIITYSETYEKIVNINVSVIKPTTRHASFTFGNGQSTEQITVDNKTYISATNKVADGTSWGCMTVGSSKIYYPIVEAEIVKTKGAILGNAAEVQAYFYVFDGTVTITDYENGGTGNEVNYTSETTTMPSGLTVIKGNFGAVSKNTTWYSSYNDSSLSLTGAENVFKYAGSNAVSSTPTTRNDKLCYSSDSGLAVTNRTEYFTLAQYRYTDNAGTSYYYYVGYHMLDANAAYGSSSSGCLAEGTQITLADGSTKPIEQITHDDLLLAWDFNTGAYAVTVPSLIESHEKGEYRVMNLSFADGTTVRVVVDHGFFDVAANNFVYLDEENVADYLGHKFVKLSGDSYESVELIGYDITVEEISYYNIQTAFYNNCIAEHMFTLNAPPEVLENDGWFDYFEIGDDMKYDEAKMQADIEKYGLYTYDDFADYVTYEQFLAFNGPYLKVLVGRGVLTFEDILALIPMYVK